MRRYLVVANQTLGGAKLAAALHERIAAGPCAFHVVVPMTRPREHLVWTEGEARSLAQERLDRALSWFGEQGIDATGEIGDERPMLAIEDALIAREFDEIVISTLPAGASKWLRQDLPARAARRSGLPVSHVEAEAAPIPG